MLDPGNTPPKLRVLLALETASGGSGRHVLDLANGLTQRGHDVSVLYSPVRADQSFTEHLRAMDAQVICVPIKRDIGFSDVLAYYALLRAIRKHGPFDILHAHSSKAGALIRAMPTLTPKIYTPHAFKTMDIGLSAPHALVVGAVETLLAWFATAKLIAVSHAERQHALHVLHIPDNKISRIVNGVNDSPLRPRLDVRSELDLLPEHFLAGFIGRLTWQKNPQLYLDTISTLTHAHPNVRGLVLGDGELLDSLFRRAQELGIHKLITFVSGQSADKYLSGMDCLVLTSRFEAMPYVMLEGLAAGLPLVSTPVGGTCEAIVEGQTGYIAAADAASLASKISPLIADTNLRSYLSHTSRQHAQCYTLDSMVTQTESLYIAEHLHRSRHSQRKHLRMSHRPVKSDAQR